MKAYLNQRDMDKAKEQLEMSDWGERKQLGNIYMTEITQMGKHFCVGQTTVTYENVSVTYTISFDEDMRLAGLYMK